MADLVVEKLTKAFPTRGEPLVVLRELQLQLDRGQNAAIVGPSGTGKSTLLHVVGGLERPTSGTVRLGGEDPFALDDAGLAQFRNRRLGFIFQEHYLLPQLSVLENVLTPALAAGAPTAEQIARARSLLERVGLSSRLEHRPAELSGGERQRAGVARALLMQPLLLLADEPTGNLDRKTAQGVAQLLLELQREERTILLVVTHSQELAAAMQRRYELRDGQLHSC